MSRSEPRPPDSEELDWLAVRYLLDELPPGDAAAFEHRLATEQPAREALAQATRLVTVVAASTAAKPANRVAAEKGIRLRRIVASLAAVAAIVLVGLVVLQERIVPVQDDAAAIDRDDIDIDPARLMVLWSESGVSWNDSTELSAFDESSLAESGDDPDDALLPPDWMLAAVQQEPGEVFDSPLDGDSDSIERN